MNHRLNGYEFEQDGEGQGSLVCHSPWGQKELDATGNFLDSDASSELVLARHLLDSGKLFSSDWFYGSELRFLHVQLVYMPLMLLLDDWQMVRYVGALIMHALYIISFACLAHAAGKSKRFFFCYSDQ